MRQFQFKAIDSKGKQVSGASRAEDLASLTKILQGQGLFLMEATAEAERPAAPAGPTASPAVVASAQWRMPAPARSKKGSGARLADVAQFTTQFAVMVRSALPILASLEMQTLQEKRPELKEALAQLTQDVRDGKPLSKSFARHPELFDEVYVSLIAAGESSGQLADMLDRVSKYLAFQLDIRDKIRTALLYPSIIFLTASTVVLFLVLFIVPIFGEVFAQFNVPVPFTTQALLFIGDFLRAAWLPVVVGSYGIWWLVSRWLSAPENALKIQTFVLDIPVVGVLMRNISMTRALRTLGALVASGVPIVQALELSRAASGNAVFNRLLGSVQSNVVQGRGLSAALKGSPYMPEAVVGMIETGEKTGALPVVIEKIADMYESQTEASIRNMFALMEPVFVVVLGLLVGGVAISILLPLFSLTRGVE